jgi:hypothetical protein
MSGYVQTNQIVILPDDDLDISENDTGKIFIGPQATIAPTNFTLPLPSPGLHYKFINGAPLALAQSVQINTNGAAGILYGSVITGPTGGIAFLAVSANTQIRFLAATSVLGDTIELSSDGTNWYVNGISRVAGGITIT